MLTDFEKALAVLTGGGVEFIVIGGVAGASRLGVHHPGPGCGVSIQHAKDWRRQGLPTPNG